MKTLIWSGWNSFTTQPFLHLALSPIQGSSANLHLVSLSKKITLPLIQKHVVFETVKMSLQIARKCGKEFKVVYYDSAIAKPALQIHI